jgi:hypothetical protein
VRVLEYRLKPGEKEPMHSHPAGVVYVLTGESIWRDPVTHAIAIDLKIPPQH